MPNLKRCFHLETSDWDFVSCTAKGGSGHNLDTEVMWKISPLATYFELENFDISMHRLTTGATDILYMYTY
jgi:hypothetical protein